MGEFSGASWAPDRDDTDYSVGLDATFLETPDLTCALL